RGTRNSERGTNRAGVEAPRSHRRTESPRLFRVPRSEFRVSSAMKVLLAGGGTGGHLMPALALAQALHEADAGVEPVLIGAERGIEAELLPRQPFPHRLLPIEPIYRRTWWRNARWLFLAPRVWREVGQLLRREQPVIVIGTGGYVAGPVVWRGQRARLPTALGEGNAFPGPTTRWPARGAPAYWCSAAARGPARLTTQSPRCWSAACWAMRTSCGARAPRTRPRSRATPCRGAWWCAAFLIR